MGTTAFIPSPGNVGEEYVTLTTGAIGGANRLLGATAKRYTTLPDRKH